MARDLSVPSIRIVDDGSLRNEIVSMYNHKSYIELNIWSIKIVNHVLSIITFEKDVLNLINEGIEICKKWRIDVVRAHDIRLIGFQLHNAAKLEKDEVKKVALRTIGQAISSAHMQEHSIVASDYHIKLCNLVFKDDKEISKVIRTKQIQWMKNI